MSGSRSQRMDGTEICGRRRRHAAAGTHQVGGHGDAERLVRGASGKRGAYRRAAFSVLTAIPLLAGSSQAVTSTAAELPDAFVETIQHETILVSRASGADGVKADGDSGHPSFSATGRLLAFDSRATTLSPDDVDDMADVYVRDLQTDATILVSRASGADGAKGNGESRLSLCSCPSVSADDRYVVFQSVATNLHLDDVDEVRDVFARDLQTHETILVSRASGAEGAKGNGTSSEPSVSADGRFVAFDSRAFNLHPEDGDGLRDVFVRDLQTNETILVSRASGVDGAKSNGDSVGASISGDGRYVSFHSGGTNLHPDDTDSTFDVFVRDLQTHTTILVSRASGADGVKANNLSANSKITPDGRFVAFDSNAGNLHPDDPDDHADAYVRDLQTHETILVSRASGPDGEKGNSASGNTSISADGRYVAFNSWASNLHPEDDEFADIFVRDLQTHETHLVSRASGPDGAKGNDESSLPSITADGRYVAFYADATNLHPDDTDGIRDIFVRDLQGPPDLTLVPSPLDFGAVPLEDTAGPLDVTLTNHGAATLTINAVSEPEAPFSSAGGTCGDPPFTLEPDESCTLDYTFDPSVLGPVATVVSVSSDSPDSPHALTLRGTGVSSLSVTPNPLELGEVTIGETGGPASLILANIGATEVTVDDVSDSGAPFAGAGGSCGTAPFVLGPEASCTLDYTFSPTAEGTVTGTVTASSDAPGSPATATLRGTGLPVPPPSIDVDPDELSVNVTQGHMETRSLSIANSGGETLQWEVTDESDAGTGPLRPTGRATRVQALLLPPDVGGLARGVRPSDMDTQDLADTRVSHAFTPLATATTLTHSESLDISFGNTVVCEGPNGTTAENHFLRTFTLTDFGIASSFDVTEVTFAVELLSSDAPITANLYTLDGVLTYDNLTLIGTATEELTSQVLTLVTIPVTGAATAGSTLVVEISAPDLSDVATFVPGSNDLGETSPSYIAASSCGLANPFPYSLIGFPNVHLVMTVTGEVDCALPDWVDVAPPSGSVPGGGEQAVEVTFDATDLEPGELHANLCLASNDPVRELVTVPLSLTVEGPAPKIDVSPDSLSSTLQQGHSEAQPLTVSNTGEEPLEWSVTEESETSGGLRRRTGRTLGPPTRRPPTPARGLASAPGAGHEGTMASHPFVSTGTETTITHSETLDILEGNTIACIPDGSTTPASQFLRTFTLTDFDIAGAFDVSEVTFGIEGLTGTASIDVNLYTLQGDFEYANLTQIGTATVELAPQAFTLVTVPVIGEAPAGATLVVEIAAPDLSGVAAFFPGSNDLGETAPSYVAANACDAPEPTPYADIGFPDVHLVMTVTGTTEPLDCTLPEWVAVDPLGGTVPSGGDQMVEVTFDATGMAPGDFDANLCLSSNDPTRPLTTVPLSLSVTASPVVLTFAPASMDFGEVEVGQTSPPQGTTLTNTGTADATGLTFGLSDGTAFDADAGGCGGTLSAGASCQISLTFSPVATGPATATLLVGSNEGASADLDLAGTGVGDGAVTPAALQVDSEGLLSDGNQVFEPGELVEVAPAWRNDGLFNESFTGTASGFGGIDGANYLLPLDHADYGSLEPTATASCLDTGICYWMGVNDPPVRPATHWQAAFDETLSDGTAHTWSLHIGDSFTDVPRSSPFYIAVETLLHHGVTGGCGEARYCPAGTNTRGQMAVFLLKAAEDENYVPPACTEDGERFADVPIDHPLCPWIEELAERGVTAGCGAGSYCPGDPVSRAQMAVFLLKAFEGDGYTPKECTGMFSDVDCPSTFAAWVEELAGRGITGGCSTDPPAYCPAAPVTRAQMAVFVIRTFGLELYGR